MFYENSKEICDEKGIKITPLILECGGTNGMLNGWKKGASPIIEIISKLAIYLEVSTDLLIFGRISNNNEPKQERINIIELLDTKYDYIKNKCFNWIFAGRPLSAEF